MDIGTIWKHFIDQFQYPLLGLLVLIVLDFLSGVGAALKKKQFNWAKIGDFYKTNVLPLVLGWLTWSLASFAVSSIPGLPPSIVTALSTGSAGVSYIAPVAVLLNSIASNTKEITTAPAQTPVPVPTETKP